MSDVNNEANDNSGIMTVYPEYLEGCADHTKHVWNKWMAMARKIDNNPERFYTIVNQETGATRVLDTKSPMGALRKYLKAFNASDKDKQEVERIGMAMMRMKVDKATLNREWSKDVYGEHRGEKTILDVRYADIIDLFSRYYTVSEIYKLVNYKWGFCINKTVIEKFFNENKEKIDRKRMDYVTGSRESRFATDAGRMETLSMLAFEMENKFESTKTIEVSKELRAIIEQIRKEIKGEEIRLTVDGRIDVNATIQANQTVHEALQKLPINMIVIGLTAAKQGINPAAIMGSLANSYYSKWNGFNKLGAKGELILPGSYIKTYDWDEIKRKNEHHIVDVEPIEVYEEKIEEVEKTEAKTQRQRMLELLEAYKTQAQG